MPFLQSITKIIDKFAYSKKIIPTHIKTVKKVKFSLHDTTEDFLYVINSMEDRTNRGLTAGGGALQCAAILQRPQAAFR